ncbi:MAG: hypothetical protein HKO92_09885 [Flavobacteriaceae bacterium]|nr:hypothetical protein [Bacteroidia bacterium]NNK83421.1 hypothetical protein [Flavobacteriaceae bacterium]
MLTLLGVGQHQNTVPNQEIIVQFSDSTPSEISKEALAAVKIQLLNIGADNIQIQKTASGLRITYFSKVDVASIKSLLDENNLDFQYSSSNKTDKPSEENKKDFNLDVFEIQNAKNSDLDFDGFVLEQKPENPRYYNPNFYFYNISFDIKEKHNIESKKYIIQKNIALAINNTSHKIPEVRAGPLA